MAGDLPNGRCTWYGMPIDCAEADHMLERGFAEQCPQNDCGPRRMTVHGRLTVDGVVVGENTRQTRPFGGALEDWERAAFAGSLNGRTFSALGPEYVANLAQGYSNFFSGSAGLPHPTDQWDHGKPSTNRGGVDLSRIKIVRANNGNKFEKNEKKVLDIIARMAASDRCNEAFKSRGRPTPRDLVEKGFTLGSAFLLTDPKYNQALGISEAERRETIDFKGAGLTFPKTTNGTPTILLSARAFDKDGASSTFSYGLHESIAHEFIHGGGIGKREGWTGHDLVNFPGYDCIICSCIH